MSMKFSMTPFQLFYRWPFNCKSYDNSTDRFQRLKDEGKERQHGITYCNRTNASRTES